MKTQIQNKKELETYIEKSSKQLFTEDGKNFQTVQMTASGPVRILLNIESDFYEVHPIKTEQYLERFPTSSKHELKISLHPTNYHEAYTYRSFIRRESKSNWFNRPVFKSVRWFPSIRNRIDRICKSLVEQKDSRDI